MSTLDEDILGQLAATAGLSGASIVVRDLRPGGRNWSLDGERPVYPASMIKVPIAVALEAVCAAGSASLEDAVTIAHRNMTTNDAPSPFEPGYVAQLGQLGWAMLAKSDNVATNVLIEVLGRASIDGACARLQLADTHVGRKLSGSVPLIEDADQDGSNRHPAADAARIFAHLAEPRRRTSWIFRALSAQVWNDKLAAGFAPEDVFAHKTGDTDTVSHDGGILVTSSGTFVIVVYTELASEPATDARFARFARSLRASLETAPRRGASTAP